MTTTAELDGLIEELTVDAYNDEEQLSGFLVGAEEPLIREEQATIAGAAVEVLGVDFGPDANAGRTRRGYVEPTEAAWSLLEAAVEPWVEDIARRASLGVLDAARRLGLGIFEALERIGQHTRNDDLLISWAPDFADETVDRVTQVLVEPASFSPTKSRRVEPSPTTRCRDFLAHC